MIPTLTQSLYYFISRKVVLVKLPNIDVYDKFVKTHME